ncbi:MAG: hypothetical protein ABII24_03480, partial [bacterium]
LLKPSCRTALAYGVAFKRTPQPMLGVYRLIKTPCLRQKAQAGWFFKNNMKNEPTVRPGKDQLGPLVLRV